MFKSRAAVVLLSAAVMGFNTSCAKSFSDQQACSTCSERDLNAPVDGSTGDSDVIPPVMNPPEESDMEKRDYSHIDPTRIVPETPLKIALRYFDANYENINKKDYLVIIDFTQNASAKRMYLINMKTGSVSRNLTAAGTGSDPDGDGNATLFSNTPDSRKSSLGFYIAGSAYQGSHGLSLRLHGMSRTNSNAFDRAIVMHGADYVSEDNNWAGRSWGCPAVDNKLIVGHVNKLKDGALIYAWHQKYSTEK